MMLQFRNAVIKSVANMLDTPGSVYYNVYQGKKPECPYILIDEPFIRYTPWHGDFMHEQTFTVRVYGKTTDGHGDRTRAIVRKLQHDLGNATVAGNSIWLINSQPAPVSRENEGKMIGYRMQFNMLVLDSTIKDTILITAVSNDDNFDVDDYECGNMLPDFSGDMYVSFGVPAGKKVYYVGYGGLEANQIEAFQYDKRVTFNNIEYETYKSINPLTDDNAGKDIVVL